MWEISKLFIFSRKKVRVKLKSSSSSHYSIDTWQHCRRAFKKSHMLLLGERSNHWTKRSHPALGAKDTLSIIYIVTTCPIEMKQAHAPVCRFDTQRYIQSIFETKAVTRAHLWAIYTTSLAIMMRRGGIEPAIFGCELGSRVIDITLSWGQDS